MIDAPQQIETGSGRPPVTAASASALVVGLGEVGGPLREVLASVHDVAGRDIDDVPFDGVRILHLCFPFGPEYVANAARYVAMYRPEVVVVHSTVTPGTTRAIQDEAGIPAVYSPVRGKHLRMAQELRRYRKFVAGTDEEAVHRVEEHFRAAGMATDRMASFEALELAKLLETTYFGVLLGWAQEMDRFAGSVGADYWDVTRFLDEIDFLPPVRFEPGFIGGHCVMPNIELLHRVRPSGFLQAIEDSNDLRRQEWEREGRSINERLAPRRSE
jgi:UDP-N-acetyl-D-mannosaminuronate dehydrogenase